MKEAIAASKKALREAAVLSYIKDRDIYVTENIRMIRNTGEYPAIGIKDGGIGFATYSSDQDDEEFTITFVAYVQLFKPEEGVMGSVNNKGALDIAKDIISILHSNDLGGLVETALPLTQGASEMIGDDEQVILMVPVTIKYTRFDTL